MSAEKYTIAQSFAVRQGVDLFDVPSVQYAALELDGWEWRSGYWEYRGYNEHQDLFKAERTQLLSWYRQKPYHPQEMQLIRELRSEWERKDHAV